MRKTTVPTAVRISGRVAAALGASLLVGGLAAGCSIGGSTDAGSAASTAAATPTESDTDKNHRLLTAAMGGTDAVVCDFTDGDTSSAGKVYIQGQGRFRFEGMSDDGPMQMVRQGETLYMWAPGAGDGLSMDVAVEQAGGSFFDPADLEKDAAVHDLSCEKYTATPKIFDVPTDVQFTSLDEMLKGAMDPAALEDMLNKIGTGGN